MRLETENILSSTFEPFTRPTSLFFTNVNLQPAYVVADYTLVPGAGNGALPYFNTWKGYFDNPGLPDGWYNYPTTNFDFVNVPVQADNDLTKASKLADPLNELIKSRAAVGLNLPGTGWVYIPVDRKYIAGINIKFLSPAQFETQAPVIKGLQDLANEVAQCLTDSMNLIAWLPANDYTADTMAFKNRINQLIARLKKDPIIAIKVIKCPKPNFASIGSVPAEVYSITAMVSIPAVTGAGITSTENIKQVQAMAMQLYNDIKGATLQPQPQPQTAGNPAAPASKTNYWPFILTGAALLIFSNGKK